MSQGEALGEVDTERIAHYARNKLGAKAVMMIVLRGKDDENEVVTTADPELAPIFPGLLRKIADEMEKSLESSDRPN